MVLLCLEVMGQVMIGAPSGLISYTVGAVYLDEEPVHGANPSHPMPTDGRIIRTGCGLAEILITPAAFPRIGEGSALRLASRPLKDVQAELQKGTTLIEVMTISPGDKTRLQCVATRTEFKSKGVYRFDTDPGIVRVYGGSAEVSSAVRRVVTGSGTQVRTTAEAAAAAAIAAEIKKNS